MRTGALTLFLACLTGCASTGDPEPRPAAEPQTFTPPEMDYQAARGEYVAEPVEGKWLRADVTLVDLDGESAREMFGLDDPSDIAPRSYDWPAGEIAAVQAVRHEHSELLARPSFRVDGETTHVLDHVRSSFYVADVVAAESDSVTPVLDEYRDVVDGSIKVEKLGNGRFNVTADINTQLAGEPRLLMLRGRGAGAFVQTPHFARSQRLGVESVRPGRTAMFQLARLETQGRVIHRLLFVRLVDTRNS